MFRPTSKARAEAFSRRRGISLAGPKDSDCAVYVAYCTRGVTQGRGTSASAKRPAIRAPNSTGIFRSSRPKKSGSDSPVSAEQGRGWEDSREVMEKRHHQGVTEASSHRVSGGRVTRDAAASLVSILSHKFEKRDRTSTSHISCHCSGFHTVTYFASVGPRGSLRATPHGPRPEVAEQREKTRLQASQTRRFQPPYARKGDTCTKIQRRCPSTLIHRGQPFRESMHAAYGQAFNAQFTHLYPPGSSRTDPNGGWAPRPENDLMSPSCQIPNTKRARRQARQGCLLKKSSRRK